MVTFILILYLILVVGLAFYTSHAYLMVYYYFKSRSRPSPPPPLSSYPVVTVQLPIYNEKYVVRRLLEAVSNLDYPRDRLQIQVLDDSTDETKLILKELVRDYQERGIWIDLYHRDNRQGFKAGALRDGLRYAQGRYICIFDADFVPNPDFLIRGLPNFAPGVAAVQARWGHLNDEYSAITRGQAMALDGHFYIEQQQRNLHGCFITFNGTCGIWRKEAIEDGGGWQDDSLTEDLDLSYRVQIKGWRIKFLPDLVCLGEVPPDINGFKAQQYRWAKGSIQTAKKLLRPLLRARLKPVVKYEGFIHLTNNLVYPMLLGLALLLLPLLLIKTQNQNYHAYFLITSLFTLAIIPYPLMYGISQYALYPNWRSRLFSILLVIGGCMALSINNTWGVLDGLFGRSSVFTRTPKFCVMGKEARMECKKYREKLSRSTFIELFMALYLGGTTIYALLTCQLTILPFLFLYTLGFGHLSIVSISQAWAEKFYLGRRVYGRQAAT
jgi:cellulose synthase/poly-beta-1,6-N-acetylglucosamine synthase-like glycosyltransferase